MDLGFCSFSSGSSGNCYLVKSDSTNILVEVGISCVKVFENIKLFRLTPSRLHGIVLSHEHWDHTRGLSRTIERTSHAVCYATKGTVEGAGKRARKLTPERLRIIHSGETFMIGDVEVSAFSLSHDAAEPTGFSFHRNGKKISIVTDTGCVTDEIREAIKDSDLLVVEANHEKNILLYGKYPYDVKRRILSDKGHLSNEAAAECICDFLKSFTKKRMPRVLLAHLSLENNTPQQAMLTVKNILEEHEYYVGKNLLLDTLEKGIVTDMIFL